MSAPIEELKLDEVAAYATGSYKPQPEVKNFGGVKLTNLTKGRKDVFISKNGKRLHISEQPFTRKNWYLKINWLNFILVVFIPISGLITALWTPLNWKTAIWAISYYFATGLSITAGYHRLFSHRAYVAKWPVRLYYAFVGGGAVEGSVRWWSASHRVHHRYTDTEKDPYNAKNGFWFSHMGWMLTIPNPKNKGRVDISDLNADPIVRWQHKHYIPVLFFMAYIFPALVAWTWGDAFGGFIYAGVLRVGFVQQATFCVNSLAHWIGDQPFDDRRTPRDHVLTALVTMGEGYHNFHHEFPSDYRNAIRWYQYDPTKFVIWLTKAVGLASDLKTFSQNAIEQGLVQQQQKKLDKWRSRLNWGIPIDQLPIIEFDDFKEQSKERSLILISGIVHDVSDFIDEHPGGLALIKSAIGKDGTAVFNGGVYLHSNAAHNLLATMRCSVIRGGCEVEVWRQQQKENKEVDIKNDSKGSKIVRAGEQATQSMTPIATADAA